MIWLVSVRYSPSVEGLVWSVVLLPDEPEDHFASDLKSNLRDQFKIMAKGLKGEGCRPFKYITDFPLMKTTANNVDFVFLCLLGEIFFAFFYK